MKKIRELQNSQRQQAGPGPGWSRPGQVWVLHNLIVFQVEALVGYRVVDIACGSGDAQTLCITDDDNVWSWGDGDYGKLGRGGSEGCKVSGRRECQASVRYILSVLFDQTHQWLSLNWEHVSIEF